MGCERKVEDPEPGRCRRTDGKKWRCSKEACPDSKYCERHMHRGKRSSRKPVDLASNPTSSRLSSPYSSLLSLSPPEAHHVPFPSSSSSGSPSICFSPQNNIPYSHLDTVTLSADKSNREFLICGLKEGVNEYNFFSEDSGAQREGKFTPAGLSSNMGETQQSSDQNLIANFAIALASEEDKVVESEDSRKPSPFNRLFNEWPQRNKGAWISLEENQSKRASYSNTQLSISSFQYDNGLML